MISVMIKLVGVLHVDWLICVRRPFIVRRMSKLVFPKSNLVRIFYIQNFFMFKIYFFVFCYACKMF